MSEPTFFWYDFETSGTDIMRDRVLQFAGQRTDMNLEPVDDSVTAYCQPSMDSLPHPEAVLLTGITPQHAQREGVNEAEFASLVHEQLAWPGTCSAGYNTIRFDDAMTRHLLYRNFYDPYAREWQNGNSRWDIIDLARMCYALRPDGIEWPQREDGTPSFKLEHLAQANHLNQEHAHDALSDVEATIDLARLIKRTQPRLWDWYFELRRKQNVFGQINLADHTPLLHVSSRYPASRGCLSMILPLAMHPARKTEIIVANLDTDPADLIDLDVEAITDRLFTPRADLPEGVERVGLRTVRANCSPAIAPLNVLKPEGAARIGLDIDVCLKNADRLLAADGLIQKLCEVYAQATPRTEPEDAELALYGGGFLPDADKPLLNQVRAARPEHLNNNDFPFRDPRYSELLFRYHARNWPDTLTPSEANRWQTFRKTRLTETTPITTLTLDDYFARIQTLRQASDTTGPQQALLDQLEAWGLELRRDIGG